MDTSTHNIGTLFQQLGLPSSDQDINHFIGHHRLFSKDIKLDEATFWTPSQASFLKEALEDDSDWSEVVDELDCRLRS